MVVGNKKSAENGRPSPPSNHNTSVRVLLAALLCISTVSYSTEAFVFSNRATTLTRSVSGANTVGGLGQTQSRFLGARFVSSSRGRRPRSTAGVGRSYGRGGSRSELGMFLGGSDGGILGVGAPEIAVTLLVGYFILGPSELYKLTKEIGKFIQNFRTLGSEASKSFEDSMENQLELDELRKAQAELAGAFSFRRSINTDEEVEAFAEAPPASTAVEGVGSVGAAGTGGGGTKKKRKRRRVKKKPAVPQEEQVDAAVPEYDSGIAGDIPDLDMSSMFDDADAAGAGDATVPPPVEESEDEFAARIRAERMERLQNGAPPPPPPTAGDDAVPGWNTPADDSDLARRVLDQSTPSPPPQDPAQSAAEQTRFASQLTDDWNAGIMANEDELSPLAKVMDRLAILEKERDAANARLDEEFRMRTELEEKFYREKRAVLEEAAGEISSKVYGDFGVGDGGTEVDMR